MAAEAGWYADPQGPGRRWWDGRAWTEHTDDVTGPAFAPLVPVTPAAASVSAVPAAVYAVASPPVGVWRGPVDDRPWVRTLADAVRVVLVRYAEFRGRAGRAEFWFWQLFLALCWAGALLLSFVPIVGLLAAFVLVVGGLAVIVPTYAVAVRRLRDAGLHWAWIFLGLVPFGGIALLVLWCQPSKYA